MALARLKVAAAICLSVGLLGALAGLHLAGVRTAEPAAASVAPEKPAAADPKAADKPQPDVPDPVETVRQALQIPIRDPQNVDEKSFRRDNLEKSLARLQTIGDLRQALALQAWKDEDRDIGTIDRPIREKLGNRLAKELRIRAQARQPRGSPCGDCPDRRHGDTSSPDHSRSQRLCQRVRPRSAGADPRQGPAGPRGRRRGPGTNQSRAEGGCFRRRCVFRTGDVAQHRAAAAGLAGLIREALALAKDAALLASWSPTPRRSR